MCLLPPCVECAAVRSPGRPHLHHIILIHLYWFLYLSLSICVECATMRSPGHVPLHHIIVIHHTGSLHLSLSTCVECARVRSPGSPPLHHINLIFQSWSLYLSLFSCVECATVRSPGRDFPVYFHPLSYPFPLLTFKPAAAEAPQLVIVLEWFRVDMHMHSGQEQLGTKVKTTGAQLPKHNFTSKRHSYKSVGSPQLFRARRAHVNLSMNVESAHTCTHGGTHTQNTRKHTFSIHAKHHMGSLC